MTLNQEGVEKAARAICEEDAPSLYEREIARRALTAYFDHLKEAGLMRKCEIWEKPLTGRWAADEAEPHELDGAIFRSLSGFILRTEKE